MRPMMHLFDMLTQDHSKSIKVPLPASNSHVIDLVKILTEHGRTVGDHTLTKSPGTSLHSKPNAALERLAVLRQHAEVIYGGPVCELKSAEGVDLSSAFVTPTLLQTNGPAM